MIRICPTWSRFGWPVVTIATVVFAPGCDNKKTQSSQAGPSGGAPRGPRVEIVAGGPGATDGPEIIRREMDRAAKDNRELLVYVGATWCEPCKRFHEAAAAGELDATFPGLRLLEFDNDRDADLLQQTGCTSQMIPFFARPTSDGHCSAQRMEGAIKGDGAVAWITPRLKHLLDSR